MVFEPVLPFITPELFQHIFPATIHTVCLFHMLCQEQQTKGNSRQIESKVK